MLDNVDLEASLIESKRHISISGIERDYIVSDIIYTEWQGKSVAYAIRITDSSNVFTKVTFKYFNEMIKFYQKLYENENLRPHLP